MRELALHILDIVENSLEAGASEVTLEIVEDAKSNRLWFRVTDNGRGMDAETVRKVTDPFFTTRTTRHVGLGLPLLKAAAERCNGQLVIESKLGQGTQVSAEMQLDHIDRAPLGDVKNTLLCIILGHSECRLRYRHRVNDREIELDTGKLQESLGDVPLTHPRVREWRDDYLDQEIKSLYE